jgi:hypothetical protein
MQKTLLPFVGMAVGLVGSAMFAVPAAATIVTPGANPNGEPFLYDVMNSLYGVGQWTQLDSTTGATVINTGQDYTLSFQARYAGDPAAVGIIGSDGTFHSLTTLSSGGTATPASGSLSNSVLSGWVPPGGAFTFGYRNTATGDLFSSDPSKNADAAIHLILFALSNQPNTFIAAWDDVFGLGDRYYNDAIVKVTVASDGPLGIPEPASLALMGAACFLLAAAGLSGRYRPRG